MPEHLLYSGAVAPGLLMGRASHLAAARRLPRATDRELLQLAAARASGGRLARAGRQTAAAGPAGGCGALLELGDDLVGR